MINGDLFPLSIFEPPTFAAMRKFLLYVIFLFANVALQAQVSELDREDQHLASNIGGKHELKRFFEQELIYPENELQNKVGGKVEISLHVKPDSTVDQVKIIKSVSPAIDAEALRIFRKLKWTPGREIGRPIDTETRFVFNFQPNKYKDICKKRGYEKFPYAGTPDTSLKVYSKVDEFPVYINGNEELGPFIQKNLVYPPEMAATNLSGQVVLGFIVEPNGLPSNIGIQKSLGAGCDQEAIRVLEMIRWKPGKKKELLVRTQMTIPFMFGLNRNFR